MLLLDALIFLFVTCLIIFIGIPAIRGTIKKDIPLNGDLGNLENELNTAVEVKHKAEEVINTAKKRAEDTLHKVEDLNKKL